LGTSSLTSFFIKDTLLKYVQHVNILFRMGDIQIGFGILIHFFMQWPLCFLQCTPPSTFIKSLISFDSSLHRWKHITLGCSHNNTYHNKCNAYLIFSHFKVII
jgi:hypothetical protein